jgi:hypothetical protein
MLMFLTLKKTNWRMRNFLGRKEDLSVSRRGDAIRRPGSWRVRRRRVVGCVGLGFWRGWSLSRWKGDVRGVFNVGE